MPKATDHSTSPAANLTLDEIAAIVAEIDRDHEAELARNPDRPVFAQMLRAVSEAGLISRLAGPAIHEAGHKARQRKLAGEAEAVVNADYTADCDTASEAAKLLIDRVRLGQHEAAAVAAITDFFSIAA
jgi:hypothetical protein